MATNRKILDDTLTQMFSGDDYSQDGLFYAHIIAQMKLKIDETIHAPAGVYFNIDHYVMLINPLYFDKYSLSDRVFILTHECLHVILDHLTRTKDRNSETFNISSDCAINQLINLPIPNDGITINSLNTKKIPKPLETAEYYYDFLIQDDPNRKNAGESNTSDDSDGSDGSNKQIDDHNIWKKSEKIGYSEELKKDITKKMIEQSISETNKSKGNIPANCQDMLDLFTNKSIVDWRKVLKKITGTKKVNSRQTIRKRPRRFPTRMDLKGKIKDTTCEIAVIVDISGSMSTDEILLGLNEIHSICKLTNTKMNMVQVDCVANDKVEIFSKNTKLFERKGSGGTYIADGVNVLNKNNIRYDALVVISDMYIEDVSTDEIWNTVNKKVLWLATSDCIPDWDGYRGHKVIKLDSKND